MVMQESTLKSVLGDHQFKTNKNAVKAIVYDFKAGYQAALERVKISGSNQQSANFTEN